MNKPELWRLMIMAVAVTFGVVFSVPNFYGESPAVQVSSLKSTVKLDTQLADAVTKELQLNSIKFNRTTFEENISGGTLKIRFSSTEEQLKGKDLIEEMLNTDKKNPSYVVALNLVSSVPNWLANLNAFPMYLGLDLRGGVYFMLEIDMDSALQTKLENTISDSRSLLRKNKIRNAGVKLSDKQIRFKFRTQDDALKALKLLESQITDLSWSFIDKSTENKSGFTVVAILDEVGEETIRNYALKQNIVTLSNRVNELGVSEPIVQQQGKDRIVVQLPGVQDTAKAKDILGRTASLEIRLVDDSAETLALIQNGKTPPRVEIFSDKSGNKLALRKDVLLTGESLTDAQAGFDSQNPVEPAVHLSLDAKGTRVFRDITKENVGNRLAILLIEKEKGEVITAPVIRSEIPGGRVQISGQMTTVEAADTALLLRAGSLAAPMEIIEERLIGPSLGAENISQGFQSTLWGFVAITIFIVLYYLVFGLFSAVALSLNITLLVALLSLLQATLTLPGIAAMALTLGMAIDSNVLINERIREEIRSGSKPNLAIAVGYEKAWATILDSNVTTLIAGLALLVFGSGPVRGFAVVHVLGILTSMFSSVLFSRGLVNIWYGRQKKISKLVIG
ncbi:MAG: protein translocase subunit SecD [Betaproteobacteria bacterium TMED82]|nr:MAG: protein translocase subunit SecD [Betaproteobacteria bacterium TMED82]|tara:strand:- start:10448 stop:12310 length:1863 start_codon:yes stop_codon:yes gene_type:complete